MTERRQPVFHRRRHGREYMPADKPVSLQVESNLSQEQYDIVLM